jgi:protein translocase SEC61 complex gamma subunit
MSLSGRLREIKEVLILASKPDRKEFSFTLKISAIGIILVGGIAFAVEIIMGIIFATP